MKIVQTLFVLALLFLFTSCSGSPVVPVEKPAPVDISVIYEGRSAQAVVPGTDMTVGQLKCYFTTNCIKATFPKFYWKLVCPFFKVVIYAQPDADVLSWVVTTEANGVDVPTAAQAQAGGWLTPIC